MVFSGGVLTAESASRRFDDMLTASRQCPFAKQPVIERSTGIIIGYVGVDWLELDARRHLEFGYRFIPSARRKGYATEAGAALLALAAQTFRGEVLAVIDPTNRASINTSEKLGFAFWKQAPVEDHPRYISRCQIG